ncbi:hypothetical protein CTA1_11385 [Colletotrichum tanaceti]|uniref:Uncharacterized protein n=1 Tax=Colletotrichum tanaceti TaxID=1306861 RepID=A0A4U6XJJ1_9PEZI|nr:hypothetical protein CTA1_11385 [Colletotrichum tanaceti]
MLLAVEDFGQRVFSDWANDQAIRALSPPPPPGFVGAMDTLADLQRLLLAVGVAAWANTATPMTWNPGKMASNKRLRTARTLQALQNALDALVNAQIANQTPPQMAPLWITLLGLYIVPVVRVPDNAPPSATFPPGGFAQDAPGMTALVNGIATGLYAIFSVPLHTKLRKVVQLCRGHSTPGLVAANEIAREQHWIAKFRRDLTEDYGRCAETYPASAISRLFRDGAYDTAVRGPQIRGFALETRVVGRVAAELRLLDQAFDTEQLDAMSRGVAKSAYRLPCAQFCRRMIPVVQHRTPQQLDDYDDDLVNTVLKTYPLPPH